MARHKVEGITLRNDNRSQLIATIIREYLQEEGFNQAFTHVATPEENSFIDADHSLLERTIEQRYEFDLIDEIGLVLNRWNSFNKEQCTHGTLGKRTTMPFWNEHYRSVEPPKPPLTANP